MALLDAYATATQYRDATGDKSMGSDDTLDGQLESMSRLLERSLGVSPGAFNASSAGRILYFDAVGGRKLWFRDGAGAYFFSAITAVGIDYDRDASYDGITATLSATWLRGFPNASGSGEPYIGLELLPSIVAAGSTATIGEWPVLPAYVKVTGTTGWSAVPRIITDLVIHRTHELREGLKTGALGTLAAFESPEQMQAQTFWLWKQAERMYGRYLPI